MVKGQGVVYINYVDDKISSGMYGHAVNIFFDVYDFDIDKRSKSAYIDIRNGDYSKITLIPHQTYRSRSPSYKCKWRNIQK